MIHASVLTRCCPDRFKEKFEEFFHDAEKDIALLETEFDMMQKKYEHVAELFTFDVNKYSQEEFFRDINKFIVTYKVGWQVGDVGCVSPWHEGTFRPVLKVLCSLTTTISQGHSDDRLGS